LGLRQSALTGHINKSGQFLSAGSPLSDLLGPVNDLRRLGRTGGAVVDDLIGKLDDVVDGEKSDFSIALLQNANFGPKAQRLSGESMGITTRMLVKREPA
jgi:hypothetical protein